MAEQKMLKITLVKSPEFSQVEINGTVHKTIYNGPDELLVDGYTLKDGDQIAVLQISNSDETLSRTNIFTYKESDNN